MFPIIFWPFKFLFKTIFRLFITFFSSAVLSILAILSLGFIAQTSPDPKINNSGKRLVHHHAPAILKRATVLLALTSYGGDAYAKYDEIDNKNNKTGAEIAGEVTGGVVTDEVKELSELFDELSFDISESFKYSKILAGKIIYENF